MKLIVDYSVMMHMSWHQMFSPNYEPKHNTEVEEYLFNLSRNLFYLKCRFKPDEMTLCLDDPNTNWRKHFLADWYESRLVLIQDCSPELNHLTYYYKVDGTIHKFERYLSTMQWRRSIPVKAEVAKLNNFVDRDRFKVITDPDLIKSMEVFDGTMRNVVPYYKGTRRLSDWKGKITKEEWKNFSFTSAEKIASVFGCNCVTVPFAEGDDVIARAVEMALKSNPEEEIVVVSVDQDLYQLFCVHPNMQYYNPTKRKLITLSPDEARWKLLLKIAGGDGGDNINGVVIDGSSLIEVKYNAIGEVTNGKKTVNLMQSLIQDNLDKGITGTDLFKPAYDHLATRCDDNTLYKNLAMIYLKNISETLKVSIDEALLYAEAPKYNYSWDDLYLTSRDRISIMNTATEDLKNAEQ